MLLQYNNELERGGCQIYSYDRAYSPVFTQGPFSSVSTLFVETKRKDPNHIHMLSHCLCPAFFFVRRVQSVIEGAPAKKTFAENPNHTYLNVNA